MKLGKVFLVGAGPGDPELITVRGLNVLRRADVVLYDRLVHPDLLRHAPADAERIYVGKASGQPGRTRQEHINQLMIAHACEGQIVVRLKGGDPFVFGRGGEEVLALSAAGISFEVVPGVSAAVAVPGSTLIPVTHRGTAAAFAVFAGHGADDASATGTDWEIAARIPTAVFLMGVERLPEIVAELLAHGRSATTPVAVIQQGTLTTQRIFTGTLRDIVERAKDAQAPATIVVGDVVNIRTAVLRGVIQANAERHAGSAAIFNTETEIEDDEPVDHAAWRHVGELVGA
jgi:uroporphyrin-III C-methyltransferase